MLLSSDQRYFPTAQISDIPCLNTSREMNLAMTTGDQRTLLGVSITGALPFVGIVPTAQQRHQHGLPQAKVQFATADGMGFAAAIAAIAATEPTIDNITIRGNLTTEVLN
jgi:hypothetical protein